MPAVRHHVMLNTNSGTAHALGLTREKLAEMFERHGIEAHIDADVDRPFAERLAAAKASEAEVIVAGGGDGTITALAETLIDTDKVLAMLPLGTVNALPRDLGIPLDLEQSIAVLAEGNRRRIDAGEVNGRIFLHKVVVGTIPGLAAGREHLRGRQDIAALFGFVRYIFRRISRSRRIAVVIDPDDTGPHAERISAIAVANNAYDEGVGRLFSRSTFDEGRLHLYVLKHLNVLDFVRLASGMMIGRWHHDEALTIQSTTSVRINTRKRKLKVMFDGEVETLDTPLNFRIRPQALTVVAPPAPSLPMPDDTAEAAA